MTLDLDMSQFHDIFFEESLEGLDVMEAGLLELNITNPDPEAINTIFRSAHSIKGGAGTFGFSEIADFTHVVESLFDEVRERKRSVSKALVDVMLESVDCIRYMVTQSKSGSEIDETRILDLKQRLESLPNDDHANINAGWKIRFHPHEHLLKTGNDPYRIIRELEFLGEMKVLIDASNLPVFSDMDPELSYLGWDITIATDVPRTEIMELFEWVEGDCELDVNLVGERRQRVERRSSARTDSDNEAGQQSGEATSIRVNIDKVDNLINLVGELVITKSMLSRFRNDLEEIDIENLRKSIEHLERNTRELQEQTLNIRMLPIDFVFQRLPRLVRDLSLNLGKQVDLVVSGNTTEVDKTVLEKIGDPMVHLIRNALDHAIETPEQRTAIGKNETGKIDVSASHEGGNIVIKIKDDGGGLNIDKIKQKALEKGLINENDELSDSQIHNLIFQPGFSTAVKVSDVSGRGVGMDVVRNNIMDLGGQIDVQSVTGEGSTFIIRLPLTLAILDGQLVKVGDDIYVISLHSIIESVQVEPAFVNIVPGGKELYRYRDEYLPIIRLHDIYNIENANSNLQDGLLIIVDANQRIGLFVDEILGQQQVVIKSLKTNFKQIQSLSGATILGDGTVAMILDLPGLVRKYLTPEDELKSVVSTELI